MKISRQEFLKTLGLGTAVLGTIPIPLLSSSSEWNFGAGPSNQTEAIKKSSGRMKIKEIEIYYFDIPLNQPFRIAIGTVTAASDVLIRIITDSGLIGLGEASPFLPITGETQETNVTAARHIREMLLGRDALALESHLKEMKPFMQTNPSIVAAFDMAFYDLLGKVAGLPLYRFLGGDRSDLETDITVDLDEPKIMAKRAKEFVNRGFRTIKVKVGQSPQLDEARIRAIREAIGENPTIRIDANQGWTVPQAIEALRRLEKYRLEFCEQPVAASDIDGLRVVREESPIPIMADESLFLPVDAIRLIKAGACDYFNIKVMKAAGLANSIRIAHIAEAANIRCMLGCMVESRLALTAAAHVMAANHNIIFADLDGFTSHTVDPIIGGMKLDGGKITLPETPGLGCEVDPAFLKKLRRV
ncbi:MAG: dipeptide epimerase [Candidatus Aminicenantes bacterium]|nr:dipeptide epimerase [Candidatus Aminicenantes bacterium]